MIINSEECQFTKNDFVYKEGNHEERYWRYMRVKAPELFDIDAFDFPTLTHCDKHDIKWLDGRRNKPQNTKSPSKFRKSIQKNLVQKNNLHSDKNNHFQSTCPTNSPLLMTHGTASQNN